MNWYLINSSKTNTQGTQCTRKNESKPKIKQWVKDNFQQLCVRIGKAKHHAMKTQFNNEFEPIQQKGRRIPIHLQERVKAELSKLLDQKHIIKLDKCSDKQLISPIVITVKKTKLLNWHWTPKRSRNTYTKTNTKCQILTYSWITSPKW